MENLDIKKEIIQEDNRYRLVKQTYNWDRRPSIKYLIEKHRKFLWWNWWSQSFNYKYDYEGGDDLWTEENGLHKLNVMNGKIPYMGKEIIA